MLDTINECVESSSEDISHLYLLISLFLCRLFM